MSEFYIDNIIFFPDEWHVKRIKFFIDLLMGQFFDILLLFQKVSTVDKI